MPPSAVKRYDFEEFLFETVSADLRGRCTVAATDHYVTANEKRPVS
jgi:hypothetical protein